jgi:hypothetical protein
MFKVICLADPQRKAETPQKLNGSGTTLPNMKQAQSINKVQQTCVNECIR